MLQLSGPSTALARLARRFVGGRGGNVALIFALALPPLALATVGGIQLSYVMGVRSTSQDVADAAALAGAQQMSLSPVGAADRAKSWAQAQLASRASSSTFTVGATATDGHTLVVTVDAYTPSFFGDMLPKGGFQSHAEATAEQQALAPLCVLIDGTAGDQLKLTGTSRLSGTCLVHGNGDVLADPAASITATRVEAGGSASKNINPAALTGAPSVSDPFVDLDLSFPTPCNPTHKSVNALPVVTPLTQTIQDDLVIPNNQTTTFLPGTYYVCGKLTINNNATLQGSDVAFIFDKASSITTKPNANAALSGRQSSALSGFVIIAARNMTSQFTIPTDPFSKITGAIYVPNAELDLTGSKTAAAASDWTVIAAKSLKVNGAANLQINTNYAASAVHVPIGVGDKAGAGSPIRLVR